MIQFFYDLTCYRLSSSFVLLLQTGMAMSHLSVLRPLLCRSLVRQVRCPLVGTARVAAVPLCPDGAHLPAACARLYATKKAKGQ